MRQTSVFSLLFPRRWQMLACFRCRKVSLRFHLHHRCQVNQTPAYLGFWMLSVCLAVLAVVASVQGLKLHACTATEAGLQNGVPVCDNVAMAFHKTLKKYRQDHGLTQTQLATLCRVSRRTISRIEAGKQVSGRLQDFISKLIQIK